MSNLKKFSEKLREHLRDENKARPFVCDGNPLDCHVFIVGYNAATEMSKEFWCFWDDNYGFKKEEWRKVYEKDRTDSGKGSTSPTRNRINWIIKAAKPCHCLETNIHAIPTPKARDLKDISTTIFNFLLQEIKPQVVFVHGSKTIKQLGELASTNLKMNEENKVTLYGNNTIIIPARHLSRGWSYDKAFELGIRLKEICQGC